MLKRIKLMVIINQIVQGVYQAYQVFLIVYQVKVKMKIKMKMKKLHVNFIKMELRV